MRNFMRKKQILILLILNVLQTKLLFIFKRPNYIFRPLDYLKGPRKRALRPSILHYVLKAELKLNCTQITLPRLFLQTRILNFPQHRTDVGPGFIRRDIAGQRRLRRQ
jgi:hypothetical protein